MKTYSFCSIDSDFDYQASSYFIDDKGWVILYGATMEVVAIIKSWSRFEIK